MTQVQPLVLDRFADVGGGRGVDLATGVEVWFHMEPAGDRARHARRLHTAAALAAVRHPWLVPLVDYGLTHQGTWVEAYARDTSGLATGWGNQDGCPSPEAAASVLYAAGFAMTGRTGSPPVPPGTDAVLCPGPVARLSLRDPAEALDAGRPAGDAAARTLAVRIQRRPELDQLLDVLDDDRARGPRRLVVVAPHGSGLRTLFAAFAREARLRGFVPIRGGQSLRLPGEGLDLAGLLARRHLVVLDDRRGCDLASAESTSTAASALLTRLGPEEGRPHLVVEAIACAPQGARVRLQPLAPEVLSHTVICAGWPPHQVEAAIRRAGRASGGWPGPFMRELRLALAPGDAPYPSGAMRSAGHVAESCDGAQDRSPVLASIVVRGRTGDTPWREVGELQRARVLAERGRHAAAERQLRRALGALRRRDRPADAGRVALAMGHLLHQRGRLTAAAAAFEEGRGAFARARQPMGEVLALVHLGALRIDAGDLGGAESTLRTALVVAEQAGWHDLREAARLLLARCVLWRGRHEDAVELTAPSPAATPDTGFAVAEHTGGDDRSAAGTGLPSGACPWLPDGVSAIPIEVGARAALAARDLAGAARCVRDVSVSVSLGGAHADLILRSMTVLVSAAIGETDRAARELADGLAEARRHHLPLMAMELRASFAEGCLQAGNDAAGRRMLAVFERLGDRVPGLVRERLARWRERLQRPEAGGVRATGDECVDTASVLDVLRACHDADDDRAAIDGVCRVLRGRLGAAAVTVFLGGPGSYRIGGTAGGRACRAGAVERCAGARFVLGPEPTAAGIEAALTVQHGGQVVGGLAVRWVADACLDAARVRGVLSAAAAAIGPAARALDLSARTPCGADGSVGDLTGESTVMAELRRRVLRAAEAPFAVLIQGESGTGKELIARAIHQSSPRRLRRFCPLNCAALTDDLFETELFGHARGAFTGASADRAGLFEAADGGTLFLDEVGELTPRAQAKLLRAIQEGEIRRIGENHSRRTDARVVAATNRPLAIEVERGRFRQDLLFRLDVLRIVVPPLREHPEDIPALAQRFWQDALAQTGGRATLAPGTVAALARYAWPGNVRELQNVMAALAVQAPSGGRVGPARLPALMAGAEPAHAGPSSLAAARRQFEERFVRAMLAQTGGRRTQAAAAMGVTRQGLAKLMARLGIADAAGASSAAGPPA